MPWEYPETSLKALCEECHEARAALELSILKRLAVLNSQDLERAANLVDIVVEETEASGNFGSGVDYYVQLDRETLEALESTHAEAHQNV